MPDLSRRWGRRAGPILAVAVLLMLVLADPIGPAGAIDPGPNGAAAATQDGWWNRLQGPQEGEPEGNPLRPAIPALPSPPTVPGDAIAVGVAGGQPAMVAAVGIEIALPQGGLIESLKLILKESASGNMNSTGAKVLACPATTPWGPAKNAAWRDRPQADCSLFQTEGVRGDDGTWTFDLTGLGSQWADPLAFAPLPQNGVVLGLDASASPAPTQVAWSDFDTGNVAVEMVATVTPGLTGPGSDPLAGYPAPGSTESSAPFTEVPYAAPELSTGAAFTDPLAFPTGQPTFIPYTPAPAIIDTPPEATTTLVAAPAAPARGTTLQAQPVVGFWEDIPAPTILLVPVAFGLALLVGLILGPAGRPLPSWPRAGGLSRALARRHPGGDAVV